MVPMKYSATGMHCASAHPTLTSTGHHVLSADRYYEVAKVRVSQCCDFPVYITTQHRKCLNPPIAAASLHTFQFPVHN